MIEEWVEQIIEGAGGLNEFERRELAHPLVRERIAVARWVIRCLGNPMCKGSEEVLEAIRERRREVDE